MRDYIGDAIAAKIREALQPRKWKTLLVEVTDVGPTTFVLQVRTRTMTGLDKPKKYSVKVTRMGRRT